jgi:hypothetical protein
MIGRGGEGQDEIFRAGLLGHDHVAILGAERDGRIVAGGSATCGCGSGKPPEAGEAATWG